MRRRPDRRAAAGRRATGASRLATGRRSTPALRPRDPHRSGRRPRDRRGTRGPASTTCGAGVPRRSSRRVRPRPTPGGSAPVARVFLSTTSATAHPTVRSSTVANWRLDSAQSKNRAISGIEKRNCGASTRVAVPSRKCPARSSPGLKRNAMAMWRLEGLRFSSRSIDCTVEGGNNSTSSSTSRQGSACSSIARASIPSCRVNGDEDHVSSSIIPARSRPACSKARAR